MLLTLSILAACDRDDNGSSRDMSSSGQTSQPSETPAPTVEPVTRLIFTGDVIPARCTLAKLQAIGDYTAPFQPLHDILAGADITAGTLDATVSDAGTPWGCVETFSLAGPAAFAEGLRYAGYDVLSHAANHIKDCGQDGCGNDAFFQTHANLRAVGIEPVGVGADVAAARRPVVVARNGVRFAFLAYDDIAPEYQADAVTPGSAPMDPLTVDEDIAAARGVADVVIIIPNWGIEYTIDPSERQREFARAAAAGGADLVVGNHPHWVQAYELIEKTFVAYALGNFVFDQDWSLETQQGALLEVTFAGARHTATRYMPVHIYDEYQPRLADGAEAAEILQRIETASAQLSYPAAP